MSSVQFLLKDWVDWTSSNSQAILSWKKLWQPRTSPSCGMLVKNTPRVLAVPSSVWKMEPVCTVLVANGLCWVLQHLTAVYRKGIWLLCCRSQLQIIFLGFLIFLLHHFSGKISSGLRVVLWVPFVTELSTSVFHSVENRSRQAGVWLHNHHALCIFSWR